MGRPRNPKGKDRPRSIVLDGDVAEIAQDLADKSQLSKVLSQLLRQSYGISDDISRLETMLNSTVDQRKQLQAKEEQLIQDIENARDALVHRQNHILPSLYQRQGALEARLASLETKMHRLPPKEATLVHDQVMETRRILANVLKEIGELE